VADASAEELEEQLLLADLPVRLVDEILEALEGGRPPDRLAAVRKILLDTCGKAEPFAWQQAASPLTILAVGVNGSGKTTTCAKLAHLAMASGLKPLLGAADTFRAAGSEQLRQWAGRVGCDSVGGAQGADAAAVAFDALDAAVARGADVLILDTAGRMHTKEPLMDELRKMVRAVGKRVDGAPHEVWIVLDASLGQNAVTQAKVFHEAVPLTGVVVTKLDGSSKAGFLFAIARELGVPIRYVGLGEGEDDLAPFDPEAFVDGLLGLEESEAAEPVS
jgi:fused signal recognition particle receptor